MAERLVASTKCTQCLEGCQMDNAVLYARTAEANGLISGLEQFGIQMVKSLRPQMIGYSGQLVFKCWIEDPESTSSHRRLRVDTGTKGTITIDLPFF